MAVHTSILDFHVDPTLINNSEMLSLKQEVESALMEFELKVVYCGHVEDGFVTFLEGPQHGHASLRYYSKGLLTLTLEEYVHSDKHGLFFSEPKLAEVETRIRNAIRCRKSKRLQPIKRGGLIDPYVSTSDNRLLEYDFDELVYEANSPYQNIKIFHSVSYGNLLVLDDMQNLAESDLIYTRTLMRYGELDYVGKTVLILGGGDGGLLHELLKEKPSFVNMIEIDQMVMEACRKHLRPVCGNCLDAYKTSNYEIIVDDCVKVMEDYVKQNKQFDYIIGDLTDIPITPTPQGEFWDFIRKILDLSFRLLAPNGKFLTHGNGVGSKHALEMYEQQLQKLHCSIEYKHHTAYVPSFMECWVFYEVWRKQVDGSYANGKAKCIV